MSQDLEERVQREWHPEVVWFSPRFVLCEFVLTVSKIRSDQARAVLELEAFSSSL